MEGVIYVGSRSNHRIDVMLAELMCDALESLGVKVTNSLSSENIKAAIVFNGLAFGNDKVLKTLDALGVPIFYMVDDIDIEVPTGYKNMKIVHQFNGYKSDYYFPIAELLVFHKLWDTNTFKDSKLIDYFYGGTYKARRDYSPLNKLSNILLVGDSKEWDKFELSTRLSTIRDMDSLYTIMGVCKNTIIVYDEAHFGLGTTLRFYEAAMLNMDVYVFNEDEEYKLYTTSDIKQMVSKEKVLLKIKGLLWNIQQLM